MTPGQRAAVLVTLIASCASPDVERLDLDGCGGVVIANGCAYTAGHCEEDRGDLFPDRDLRRLGPWEGESYELGEPPALWSTVRYTDRDDITWTGMVIADDTAGNALIVAGWPSSPGDSGNPAYVHTDVGPLVWGVVEGGLAQFRLTWVVLIPTSETEVTCRR